MAEERREVKLPHNIILQNRKLMTVSGVVDVDSFDEQCIIVFTDIGELTIRGIDLHITKLSIESGELSVEGEIDSIVYSDNVRQSGGFFSRLFK